MSKSDIATKYGIKIGGVNELVPNLRNKKKTCYSLQKSYVVFIIRGKTE